MGKRRKKKGRLGRVVLFFFILGVLVSLSLLFQKEIGDLIRPLLEKVDRIEKRKEVVLYFSDREGEYLVGELRKIKKRGEAREEVREVIEELIRGPKRKLIPTLPPRAKCLSVRLNGKGVASINFNQSFAKDHPGGSSAEILTVYSIVNSLARNFPQIKEVQILIEGKPIETIAGHLSLRHPIAPKPDLIKGTP